MTVWYGDIVVAISMPTMVVAIIGIVAIRYCAEIVREIVRTMTR